MSLPTSSPSVVPMVLAAGALGGAVAALVVYRLMTNMERRSAVDVMREALPRRIILLRHGESEGNADETLYRTKADNLIELTSEGTRQSLRAGKRIRELVKEATVDMYVSPFQRTLQTARNVRKAFRIAEPPPGAAAAASEDTGRGRSWSGWAGGGGSGGGSGGRSGGGRGNGGKGGRAAQVRHTHIDPRVREQEFGNLQGDEFKSQRAEQKRVGRFWYRFPTGESGADVYDRTKQWWDSAVMQHNLRPGFEPVDNIVVVTHGLTMRFILMQLFGWSPHTFSTVWNAGNCDMYVLKYDASLRGKCDRSFVRSLTDQTRTASKQIGLVG